MAYSLERCTSHRDACVLESIKLSSDNKRSVLKGAWGTGCSQVCALTELSGCRAAERDVTHINAGRMGGAECSNTQLRACKK